jgi:hypothetical protein
MSESQLRYFTLDEANATLPYVRSIVADVAAAYAAWRDHVARYDVQAAGSRSEVGETDAQVALRQEVDRIARSIGGYLAELEQVGCLFKGFDDGLVDFLSIREGREVYLCWKLGEPEIAFWHELKAGFAGRRPLAPEYAGGRSR